MLCQLRLDVECHVSWIRNGKILAFANKLSLCRRWTEKKTWSLSLFVLIEMIYAIWGQQAIIFWVSNRVYKGANACNYILFWVLSFEVTLILYVGSLVFLFLRLSSLLLALKENILLINMIRDIRDINLEILSHTPKLCLLSYVSLVSWKF